MANLTILQGDVSNPRIRTCSDCPLAEFVECSACAGEGGCYGEDMGDPLWYGTDEWVACTECGGHGGWLVCGMLYGGELDA